MGIAGGYLAQKVRPSPPVSSVPSGQTGILPGRGLLMRSFLSGRLGCPGDPGGGRSVHPAARRGAMGVAGCWGVRTRVKSHRSEG
jgi:hypothetical protein